MFKRYKPFFRAGAMDCLAYKSSMFGWVIVSVLEVLSVFFMWIGVYKSSADGVNSVINGFTFHEMLVYVTFVNVFNFVSLNGDTMYFIVDDIDKGTIAMSFVKPISYRMRFAFTNLGNAFMKTLILGLPLFAAAYAVFVAIGFIVVSNWWLFPLHVLLFFVAQVLAILLNDAIDYIFGVLCFYTTAAWGLNQIKSVVVGFLSGSIIPLTFFPGILGTILAYSPFSGISQNPVFILMMKISWTEAFKLIGIAIVWWAALELIGKCLFSVASRKVTVQGG